MGVFYWGVLDNDDCSQVTRYVGENVQFEQSIFEHKVRIECHSYSTHETTSQNEILWCRDQLCESKLRRIGSIDMSMSQIYSHDKCQHLICVQSAWVTEKSPPSGCSSSIQTSTR